MFKSGKTIRHIKKPQTQKQIMLEEHVQKTLGIGQIEQAILLPPGEDLNEWLAVHCLDFFKESQLLYDSIAESCTKESCPVMTAGPQFEYRWKEGKELFSLPANEYINKCLDYVQQQLDDEAVFPCTVGVPFPKKFQKVVQMIFKRLFRVYAHIYLHHLNQITQLEEEPHLNSSFKHFILFATEFSLLDKKEVTPMMCVIHLLVPSVESKYK
ncbi:Mob1/phocein family protein [Entamoeba histolytica HM-3:IMSS]|uniref:Mob1/phocein family protein n=4 Tax=Entamoeba histolytica TaxID=5759 RepID=C4LX38_ENTH1|nr:Mob1/phocein family protein [Entamoeba histolytica HM-1:IMSS]XP_653257.1 Mob1/phocein family protein [Entamoeba histolytica HM-1:IMSS]EMD42852.1 Mob1/phocein family protein [Entamoeba histolytica KU27]EMS14616.1 Mob1/phocein family protein [Entamoeba histolytica HM-3:IMSS]GAT93292.1 mob1 phocein family protein [Entamoeba histolytica]EAL44854.1 Mob1/phocein family protein [Entamoeba histolytica HM-1:IMSS]EAL47871.1 Mob1/phocein family protein [Entamoeba histolytica HM-1:IMSS]|eukprot:XP_650241.1 Mob1/phocein family protein [Entamoeba histolytica HM-1:IMSS]